MAEEVIYWTDVETNGLDPEENVLLEVAILVTDLDLNVLDDEGFHSVIHYYPDEIEAIKELTVPYVLDMHTKTGLWDKLHRGTDLEIVDGELLEYMKSFSTTPRLNRIGGNSITLDRNFMNRYLPHSFGHLSYRSWDVSTLAGMVEHRKGLKHEKKSTHEAMSDIRESIDELRFLWNAIDL